MVVRRWLSKRGRGVDRHPSALRVTVRHARGSSLQHYHHFLLGVVVPLVNRLSGSWSKIDYVGIPSCGPLDRVVRELGIPRVHIVGRGHYRQPADAGRFGITVAEELPHGQDETRAEAWYYVADNDVFPETFMNFLGFDAHLKRVFYESHGEILTAEWWRGIQHRLRDGELLEVLPYHRHRVRVFSSL